jgi:hypothetical protein
MGIDIKFPIGLMFSILGILITVYGLTTMSDTEMYQKSFGVNINLWSGIGMMIFGGIMLLLIKLGKKKKAA